MEITRDIYKYTTIKQRINQFLGMTDKSKEGLLNKNSKVLTP